MSAFYAAIENDAVHLMTDGAIYSDDGTVMGLAEKVYRAKGLPIAIAQRGNSAVSGWLAFLLEASCADASVDRSIVRFMRSLQQWKGRLARIDFDILVGCYSETMGPQLHYVTSFPDTRHGDFAPVPFEFYDVGKEFGAGPFPSVEALAAAGLGDGDGQRPTFAKCGVSLFAAMRCTKMQRWRHPDTSLQYLVGGHVDYTVIDAAGAETVRILEWPDKVGEKIDPFTAVASAEARAGAAV